MMSIIMIMDGIGVHYYNWEVIALSEIEATGREFQEQILCFRCPYQANVMKMLEIVSNATVCMGHTPPSYTYC